MDWQLAEAKNKFSEVFRKAQTEGPQRVTCRGEAVVIVAEKDYAKSKEKRPDLMALLLNGPGLEDVFLERDQSAPKVIEF